MSPTAGDVEGCPRADARSGYARSTGCHESPSVVLRSKPGANTCELPSRHETHEQEHAGHPARDGIRRQQPRACVRVRDEVLAAT
jgi:hypothetical protein